MKNEMKIGTKVILTPDGYWTDKELPSGAIGVIIDDDYAEDIPDDLPLVDCFKVDFGETGIFWLAFDDLSETEKAMNYPSYYHCELL